jgi:hypothetical protein
VVCSVQLNTKKLSRVIYCNGYVPNRQSGGAGFDPWQRPTCPGLAKPTIFLRSVDWYQLRPEVKIQERPKNVSREGRASAIPVNIPPSLGMPFVKRALVISNVRIAVGKPEFML